MKKQSIILVAMNKVEQLPIGAIFRHYKGKEYKILQIGLYEADLVPCVVYQGLYECESFGKAPIWIRPISQFLELVEVEGKSIARFTLVSLPPLSHEK